MGEEEDHLAESVGKEHQSWGIIDAHKLWWGVSCRSTAGGGGGTLRRLGLGIAIKIEQPPALTNPNPTSITGPVALKEGD